MHEVARQCSSDSSLAQATRRAGVWLMDPLVWLIAVFAVISLFAPLLATHKPVEPNIAHKLQPPSTEHFFGTDHYGMDVYSRVLYATRTDFSASIIAVLVGVLVGVPLGALGGYVGGILDNVLNRVVEIVQAIPQMLFAMAALALIGSNLTNLILVVGLFVVPGYLKLVRSVVLSVKNTDFVRAARCGGASTLDIVVRHILPNTIAPFFGQFAISCAYAVQNIAGLSFLGLGLRPPRPTWGSMISHGASHMIFGHWWPSLFPGLAVFLAVLMMRQIGERVRRRYSREV